MGDDVGRYHNQHEDTLWAQGSVSATASTSDNNCNYNSAPAAETRRPATKCLLEARDGEEEARVEGTPRPHSVAAGSSFDVVAAAADTKERKRHGRLALQQQDPGRPGDPVSGESEEGEETAKRQGKSQHQLKRLSLRIREKIHLAFTTTGSGDHQTVRTARESYYHQNSQSLPQSPKGLLSASTAASESLPQLLPAQQQPLASSRSSPSFSSSSSLFSTSPSDSPGPTSPKSQRSPNPPHNPPPLADASKEQEKSQKKKGKKQKQKRREKEKKTSNNNTTTKLHQQQQQYPGSAGAGSQVRRKAAGSVVAAAGDPKTERNNVNSTAGSKQQHNNNNSKNSTSVQQGEGEEEEDGGGGAKEKGGGKAGPRTFLVDRGSPPSTTTASTTKRTLGGMFSFSRSHHNNKGGSLEDESLLVGAAAASHSPTRSRTSRKKGAAAAAEASSDNNNPARKIVKSDEGKMGSGNAQRAPTTTGSQDAVTPHISSPRTSQDVAGGDGGGDGGGEEDDDGLCDEADGWIWPTTDLELLIEAFASTTPTLHGSSSGSGDATPVLGWVSRRPMSPRGGGGGGGAEQAAASSGSPKKRDSRRLRLSTSLSSFAFSPNSSTKKQHGPPSGSSAESLVSAKAEAKKQKQQKKSGKSDGQDGGKFRFLHLQRSSAQLPLPSSSSSPSLPAVDKDGSGGSVHTLRAKTPSKEELKQIKAERKNAKKLEKLEKKKQKRISNGENKKRRSARKHAAAGSADKDGEGTRSITSSQEKSTDDDNGDGDELDETNPKPHTELYDEAEGWIMPEAALLRVPPQLYSGSCEALNQLMGEQAVGASPLHATFDQHQLLLGGVSSSSLQELLEIEIVQLKEEEARRATKKQQKKAETDRSEEAKKSAEWRTGRLSPVPPTGSSEERVILSGLRKSKESTTETKTSTETAVTWKFDSSECALNESLGWIDPAYVGDIVSRHKAAAAAPQSPSARELESSGESPSGEESDERGWILPEESDEHPVVLSRRRVSEREEEKVWRGTTPPPVYTSILE